MKKLVLVVFLIYLTACASTKDVASLQSQVDELKTPVVALQTTALEAKLTALDAATRASAANYWAVTAEKNAEQIQFKLDKLVGHSVDEY